MTTLTTIALIVFLAWAFVTAYAAWEISRTTAPHLVFRPGKVEAPAPGGYVVVVGCCEIRTTEQDSGPAIAVGRREKDAEKLAA